MIQRCLQVLKTPVADPDGCEMVVLSGMGGLGKSTLASRLVERKPTHQRAVLVGRIDETSFLAMINRINFDVLPTHNEATAILNDAAPLDVRIRYLMHGPLQTVPTLFVFDDFENGNLDQKADGTYACTGVAHEVIAALATAIRETNSASRIIVTSRYQFGAPTGTRVHGEPLETLNANELRKKLGHLNNLNARAATDPTVKQQAIKAAAGIPRLLEWLNAVLDEPNIDPAQLLNNIETTSSEFRENIVAEALIEAQSPEAQKMLARVNLVELPIPNETIAAMCPNNPNITTDIDHTARLGLLESGTDPATSQPRYLVSNVLTPLLANKLDATEQTQACAAAAQSLHTLWWNTNTNDNN